MRSERPILLGTTYIIGLHVLYSSWAARESLPPIPTLQSDDSGVFTVILIELAYALKTNCWIRRCSVGVFSAESYSFY